MSLQVLSALEHNLRQEQRATCEQEFVTFKHLLTPIQVTAQACADWCTCWVLHFWAHQLVLPVTG